MRTHGVVDFALGDSYHTEEEGAYGSKRDTGGGRKRREKERGCRGFSRLSCSLMLPEVDIRQSVPRW